VKVGFILARDFWGKAAGSSRIRGDWLILNWPQAEVYRIESNYDVLIFQKAPAIEMAEKFYGLKIYDTCDPKPKHDSGMKEVCDVFTAPNSMLLAPFDPKPCYVVRDLHHLPFYTERKVHHEGPPKMVAWFGFHPNFHLIDAMLPVIRELGLKLKVISNEEYPDADIYKPYSDETINEDLLEADIVIDPRGELPWKNPPELSHKTAHAQLLNLPVANTDSELRLLCKAPPGFRNVWLGICRHCLDVANSVRRMRMIIEAHLA